MANSFLVLVPHKTLRGTISILIRPKLATNVGKMRAVKNKMPFIPQCPGSAQVQRRRCRGTAGLGKPTLFHRQGMRPHAELHSAAVPWKWALEAQSKAQFSADWDAETMQICAELCLFEGVFLGTHADHPSPAELTFHVRLEPNGVEAGYARRRKRRDHAKAVVLQCHQPSCHMRGVLGISNVVPEDLSMNEEKISPVHSASIGL